MSRKVGGHARLAHEIDRPFVSSLGVTPDARLWELFREVATRGAEAWPELMTALEPELTEMARFQPVGRLRDLEDTPHEITTRVFARLYARELAAVRKLCAMDPPPVLRAWLRVIVRRSAIDYMREHPDYERETATRPSGWITIATLTSAAPAADVDSLAAKRREVLDTLREMVARTRAAGTDDDALGELAVEWRIARIHVRRLAARGDQLVDVFVGLLEGRGQAEIAETLGTTRREVELGVRYIEALLRARFGTA
jgi:DNA-directed RNA polymerase specialized sigma24 family protein